MKVLTSVDYKRFKRVDFNRSINDNNLQKLVNLNKKVPRFHLFPILVDLDMKIIDGQHRFEACKILKLPVYYIITQEQINPTLIHDLNIAGKKHSFEDMALMLSKTNNKAAEEIIKQKELNPKLTITTVAEILLGATRTEMKSLIMDNKTIEPQRYQILSALSDLPCDKVTNRMARAFEYVIRRYKIEPADFADRIKRNWFIVVDAGREKEVIKSLISAYNYKLNQKNKLAVTI